MLSPAFGAHRIACVADMTAAPDVIGVEDIEPVDRIAFLVFPDLQGNLLILLHEKILRSIFSLSFLNKQKSQ